MATLLRDTWFAAQVVYRSEKRVAGLLESKGYEQFCPTYVTEKRWSDRLKKVEEPLFPGYVFVRAPMKTLGGLLCSTPGLIRILSFGGCPAVLPDAEIEAVRTLSYKGKALPTPNVHLGDVVRICDGPFTGITGIVRKIKDRSCLIFSVQLISQSIYVEVEGFGLEHVESETASAQSSPSGSLAAASPFDTPASRGC